MSSRNPQVGWRWLGSMAILGCLLLLLCACGGREHGREVVLYSSVDESYTLEVARCFERKTGIRVKLVSDTEATKSTGLLNRLIAEQTRPVADVFWSGDVMRAAVLKERGIAEPYRPAGRDTLPAGFSDPDNAFTGSAARLRLIMYHKERLGNPDRLPKSVLDLARPEFAPFSCIANPLFGTSSMHAAALFQQLGNDRARAFFHEFSANGGRMLSSNGEVRRRVAAGEFVFGLTDSDDVSVALADGKAVGFVVPDQGPEGTGAVLMPTAAVLIKGAPHPEQARLLVDFLVSAQVEKIMAESIAAHFPLRPEIPPPGKLNIRLSDIKVVPLDVKIMGKQIVELQNGFLADWVAAQSQ